MVDPYAWCRVTVIDAGDTRRAQWVLAGADEPDLSVVEALACHQLAARRRGERVVIDQICPTLDALLAVAGLRGQMIGNAEEGEQLGIEEAVEPDDPTR